jgi:hypothetical protein
MRFADVLLVLLGASAAPAQEPQGRYQGLAFEQKRDGTHGAQVRLFMIFRPEGQNTACSGGTDSFEEQVPCEDVVAEGRSTRNRSKSGVENRQGATMTTFVVSSPQALRSSTTRPNIRRGRPSRNCFHPRRAHAWRLPTTKRHRT